MNEINLETLQIFEGIPSNKIPSVSKCLQIRTLFRKKEESLLFKSNFNNSSYKNDSCPEICYLAAGSARIIHHDSSGLRTILESISADTVVYEDSSFDVYTRNNLDIVATEPCTMLKISFSDKTNSCPRCIKYVNTVRANLLALMAEGNARLMKKICMLSNRSIQEKLLSYLNSESQKAQSKTFLVSLNRQELADYLCA